jgi:hypothetical protein
MLPLILALGANVERTLELVLTALPGLIGAAFVWLALHRLRHPVRALLSG